MLTNLIPVFVVFAVLYLIIAIVLQRRRDRLTREREAKRERDRLEERAERQSERDLKRSGQRQLPPTVHSDPFVYLKREIPTVQDIAWLNTWLTDDSITE